MKEPPLGVREILERMGYGPAPESDKPVLDWRAGHNHAFGIYVGGRWAAGEQGKHFHLINPATTQRLARGVQASAADLDAALRAAREGPPGWAARGAHTRA